jgi:hypothetical protein
MCVCVHVCVWVYVCIFVCVCMCVYECVYVCVFLFLCCSVYIVVNAQVPTIPATFLWCFATAWE